jgi:5S rRNA maturation endonuclease (ribonuclease M5)
LRINEVSEEEEIGEIVRIINEVCEAGAAVVVEGETDREALVERGVAAKILTLRELMLRAEHGLLEDARVIVLLDLDREGERLTWWLRARLPNTVRLDFSLRERIRRSQRFKRGRRTIQQIFMGP